MSAEQTHFVTCPLCEATCGLEVRTRDREVVSIRGDRDDVFSRGYLCPKATALKDLDRDPDRLRAPLVRRDGRWDQVSWDEAFAEVDRRMRPILDAHGRDAIACYLGNPSAHNLGLLIYGRVLLRALGSRNVYSASTVDQMPKQVSAGLMFGTGLSVPVPDLDRTNHLLVLGADPLVSNGSLMTAPDVRGRLRAIRERGGRVVVVDPRRSRTAEHASEHHFIRPGTDAHLLFAMVHVLFRDGLVRLDRLADLVSGLDEVAELAKAFPPEVVAPICGIDGDTIARLARELAAAPCAAVYGRIGTCTQEFGTLASWLVDVLNTLTGNLDRAGGAMFTRAAAGAANTRGAGGRGRGIRLGRHRSRVRELPEVFGELPVVCLPEEIQTPGPGRIRGLITIAGNPVLSTPNGDRLAEALAGLDCMVSLDIYLNETTRHAHVILPGLSPLETSHYDLALWQLAVRNVANYSAPVFPPPPGQYADWESVLRLTGIVLGQGPDADLEALDDLVATQQAQGALETHSLEAVMAALAPRRGPERLLDLLLRTGPYGDHFGTRPGGLSLATLEAHPHGVDLGALAPRLPEVLRTPSGRLELAPAAIVADVARLREALDKPPAPMVLIGRRQLRSNNSWMHNVEPLVRGRERCTLLIHPADAARLGLEHGGGASVQSRTGTIELPVEITDAIMPGVVSVPHGWGHDVAGTRLQVASRHAGVCSNRVADEDRFDPLSGNAVLNGLPVHVEAVAAGSVSSAGRG
jgi:anaerobic selenocysteine-containing dehydrogenase